MKPEKEKEKEKENVFELKRALQEFLEKHPELQEMQLTIAQAMHGAGKSQLNRNMLLQDMMFGSLERMREVLTLLGKKKEEEKKTLRSVPRPPADEDDKEPK